MPIYTLTQLYIFIKRILVAYFFKKDARSIEMILEYYRLRESHLYGVNYLDFDLAYIYDYKLIFYHGNTHAATLYSLHVKRTRLFYLMFR